MKHFLFLLPILASLIHSAADAQSHYEVSGRVLDAQTGNPLAFVHVLDPGKRQGTTTNMEGFFTLRPAELPKKIRFIYMGYETREIALTGKTAAELKTLRIFMRETYFELEGVDILPRENPAVPIIRRTIAGKSRHDPHNLPGFTYDAYNRFWVTTDLAEGEFPKPDAELIDTARQKMFDFLNSHHLFVMESVVERTFLYPAHNEEKVTAMRASGFQQPHFLELAHGLQVFNFYEESIRIGLKDYRSPLAKDALNRYYYTLEDTTFYNEDTVWVISYVPRNRKFYGLHGTLFIHSVDYAIEKVLAETTELTATRVSKIQQQYRKTSHNIWFPDELYIKHYMDQINFSFAAGDTTITTKAMGIAHTSVSNVNTNPGINRREMGRYSFYVPQVAYTRDESWWLQYRDPIDSITANTYQFIDSIGDAWEFDKVMNFGGSIITRGHIPWGIFDFNLREVLHINKFEGIRPGLGLETNNRLSRHFSIGGFGAYGFSDQQFKYGGHLRIRLHDHSDTRLLLSYRHDVEQPGREQFLGGGTVSLIENFLQNTVGELAEDYETFGISVKSRPFRYLRTGLYGILNHRMPRSDYRFTTETGEPLSEYTHAEIGIRLRYAYGEDLLRSGDFLMVRPTPYPVIHLNYHRGISGVLNSDVNYNRLSVKITQKFYLVNAGPTSYELTAGMVDRAVPLDLLYTGTGGLNRPKQQFSYFVPGTFQTMGVHEFAADQYIELFAEQVLGSRIWLAGTHEPLFVLESRAGLGRWKYINSHENFDAMAMTKGFFESGLRIERLINEIGVGVFYRYGPYAFDSWEENLNVKVVWTR